IQNKAMEKIRIELESKFLGTRPVEEAAAGQQPGQPGQAANQPGTPAPESPREDLNSLMALN
ncbi:MAG: hypothetical protein K2Q20_14710, partial [Phycisphaerales bacterium]|nr:hypothetical protein [Phycisphaerales bacterium]